MAFGNGGMKVVFKRIDASMPTPPQPTDVPVNYRDCRGVFVTVNTHPDNVPTLIYNIQKNGGVVTSPMLKRELRRSDCVR